MNDPAATDPAINTPQGNRLHAFTLSAADRVRSLAEDIDGVIAGIRADAEAYPEGTQAAAGSSREPPAADRAELLSQLADALTDYTTWLRHQCDELGDLLDQLAEAEPKDSATADDGAAAVPSHAAPPRGGAASEGLRLLAAQMAASGSTRAEIEHWLRTEFKVANVHDLLDEIFAP